MANRALVVLAAGFEETEAITTIDILRRGSVTVTTAGLESREVTGSHGITVLADARLDEVGRQFDAVILPGGQPGTDNLACSPVVLDLLRETSQAGGLCAAICAAPLVLAKAGLLKGKRACCYPGIETKLEGAIVVTDPVVRDGNVVTSRGVATAIPFALTLVGCLTGESQADSVAEKILYGR